jgi:hypothetical protein
VNPQALVSRGNMAMRRAPRRGAIVFENRIRELQTSVERTGVAIGPHPRAPGSPSQRAGRREGRNTLGGGDLARRDLRTSDVVEKRAPVGSRGNAIHCQVERGPRTRSGPKRSRRDRSEAGSERLFERTEPFVQTKGRRTRNARARSTREKTLVLQRLEHFSFTGGGPSRSARR